MRWIENAAGVADDDRDEFRFKALARATEGVRDAAGALDLRLTYRDLYRAAVQGLYGDRQEKMRWDLIRRAFERGFDPDDPASGGDSLDSGTTRACRTLLANLTAKHGYCPRCARDGIIYAVGKGLME
ncbi:MAG: hypothetical protein ACYTGX_08465 [Planctomycetota bacterium]|jgi:hypothetical protein